MSFNLYLAYLAACVVLVIVPGPTVTVIVANSLRYGARAGLLNVAGTQLGLAVMIGIVILGLASLLEAIGWWFEVLRLAGAAYLIWLGIRLLRADGALDAPGHAPEPRGGFFLQGFVVLMSNPKIIVLFGALFPQFIDPKGDYLGQVLLLGITAMVTAAVFDSIYAITAGRAGAALSRVRVRLLSRISGGFLIGGGIWLALTRTR
ncbi:MAG: LysE family translocator [Rhizobiales bacterium]|nr:LysE family translocator [Hyphomicrobiales bacterium]